MSHIRRRNVFSLLLLSLFAVWAGACTDAPSAPDAEWGGQGQLAIAPQLTLSGGPAATSHTAADALRAAFDQVDRFRLVVTRPGTGEVVADEVILVTGDPPYELSLDVPVNQPNEEFDVELTALAGATELFHAGPIRVRAVPEGVQTEATPVDAGLEYVGPGAKRAASVAVTPDAQVLAPGGRGEVEVEVLDESGNVVHAVPVGLASSDAAVVEVSGEGDLTAGRTGLAQLTATTPTGLTGSASVYVVEGSVVFVRQGRILEAGLTSKETTTLVKGPGAGQPAFSADGLRMVYVRDGTVFDGEGTALTGGSWPSISPDETKLAVEQGGTVVFTNADGSNATEGFDGSAPAWMPEGKKVLVQGGSLEEVDARHHLDERQTLVEDPAAGPGAVAADGRVAYVGGNGAVRVRKPGGELLQLTPEGVGSSRPAWSADGQWLVVVLDDDLHLVPADGSGPPAALPVGAGTEPAWRGHAFGEDPVGPSIDAIDPEEPREGDEVTITGAGFDAIIPANNRVTFPGQKAQAVAGPRPVIVADVLDVTPTELRVRVPEGAESGDLIIETFAGQAGVRFQVAPGSLKVTVTTGAGQAVEGVTVQAVADGEVRGSGTTGADGSVEIADLPADQYDLEVDPPDGFGFEGPAGATVRSGRLTEVALTVDTEIVRVVLQPAEPRVEVGLGQSLVARAFDIFDDPVDEFESSEWTSSSTRISLAGRGFEAGLTGQHPSMSEGDAGFQVTLDGVTAEGAATVTTFIKGTVESGAVAAAPGLSANAGPQPVGVRGITMQLLRDGEVVNTTQTDAEGNYTFRRILGGPWTVRPAPSDDYRTDPEEQSLVLDQNRPVAENVDFTLQREQLFDDRRRPGDIAIYKNYNSWFGENKDETVLQGPPFNFTKGSDYFVRPMSDLQTGIPQQTSLLIITSASRGDLNNQITEQRHPDAVANLEQWIRDGGWLVIHAGDNSNDDYIVPGLDGFVNEGFDCSGLTLAVDDHPFVRGPDGQLGTSDDLTDDNIDETGGSCAHTHGHLGGLLPNNAQVLLTQQDDDNPAYATYTLGQGRVIVGTLTFEWGPHPIQTLINHFTWAVFGNDPPGGAATVAPQGVAGWTEAAGTAERRNSNEVPPPGDGGG